MKNLNRTDVLNGEANKLNMSIARAALLTLISFIPTTAGKLPNVVLIMADDLGWSDVAAYRVQQGLEAEGATPIPTPNLDRLVAGGLMFTDAHSPCSLCAPTRFAMLTGSLPFRIGKRYGTWNFSETAAVLRNRKHTTVGEIMQAAGYRTSMMGKMHVGGGNTYSFSNPHLPIPTFPTSYGFDYTFLVHDGIQAPPYVYFENDRFARVDPTNHSAIDTWGTASDLVNGSSGNPIGPNGTGSHKDGWRDANWNGSQNGIINTRKAVEFIDRHLANHGSQPFLLYYNSPQVHIPHTPPVDFEPDANGNPGSPPNVPVQGVNASWGGNAHSDMVHEVDLQVGRILAKLDDPDGNPLTNDSVLTDTLIMFTSDNGGLGGNLVPAGYDSTGILRASKGRSYEGGHRVPFIAHWGDGTAAGSTIAPGTISNQIIAGQDWVATMYALTEQDIAGNQCMDSVNLLPVLLGHQEESEAVRPFVLHQAGQGNNQTDAFGIRRGDHVLIINRNRSPRELFNLAEDLSQSTNLVDPATYPDNTVPPEVLALRDELHALFMKHDDVNSLRTTTAYDTDGFAIPPIANGADEVTMTSVSGVAAVGPVEYRFTETTGNWGGTDSDWQASPTNLDTGLVPGTRYAYKVEMRDGEGKPIPTAEQVAEVITPTVNPFSSGSKSIFTDDFDGGGNPANLLASDPKPTGTWYQQDVDDTPTNPNNNFHWSTEEHPGSGSTYSTTFNNLDALGDADNEFHLGFGFDEVRLLYNSGTAFDLSQDYTFDGSWELYIAQNLALGFIAGLAEFDATTGALVQTIGFDPVAGTVADSQIFGDTSGDGSAGDMGTFSITVTAANLANANVKAGNHAGVYLHRDDDGVLGNDVVGFAPNRGDRYLVDDVRLVAKGSSTSDSDTDSDLIPDSVEDATPGLDKNDPTDGKGDLDGDGHTNAREFLVGSDMLTAGDLLPLLIEVPPGTDVEINLLEDHTLGGRVYILERSEDLGSASDWVAIDAFAPTPTEAGAAHTFTAPEAAQRAYFRSRIEWAPVVKSQMELLHLNQVDTPPSRTN